AQLGPASDWYSVGLVLYEALTGTNPFAAAAESLATKWLAPPVPPNQLCAEIPSDLSRLCMELLASEPDARPRSEHIVLRLLPERAPATVETVRSESSLGPNDTIEPYHDRVR